MFGECQYQAENVLSHGAIEDSAGVGQYHVAVDQLRKQHGIYAGAGPMYPLQVARVGPDAAQIRVTEAPP